MALRSGYKGFKKLLTPLKIIRPGTLGIDNDVLIPEINKTFFPRSEQAVLGAKNLLKFPYADGSSKTDNGITYSVDSNGVITLSNTATGRSSFDLDNYDTKMTLSEGSYTMDNIPAVIAGVNVSYWNGSSFVEIGTFNASVKTITIDSDTAGRILRFELVVTNGTAISTPVKFSPMLRLASDPDSTYAPYAMSNIELTDNKLPYDAYIAKTIPANADLDDYIDTGFYCPGSASDAASITHKPEEVTQRFNLTVTNIGAKFGGKANQTYANNVVIQKIDFVMNGTPCLYMRYHSYNANWTSWYKFTGTELT